MQKTTTVQISKFQFWLSEWSSPSLYGGLLLLATCIFYWDGMDLLTPFIFPLIAFAVRVLFIGISIGALTKGCLTRDQAIVRRFRFVILDLVVALVAIFFPFLEVRLFCDFNFNLNKRMQVVEMARSGTLRRPHGYNRTVCALPLGFEYLSKGGGEVIVTDGNNTIGDIDRNSFHVLFYTFRGVLSHYSGFVYTADAKPPVDYIDAKEIRFLRKYWYWVAN